MRLATLGLRLAESAAARLKRPDVLKNITIQVGENATRTAQQIAQISFGQLRKEFGTVKAIKLLATAYGKVLAKPFTKLFSLLAAGLRRINPFGKKAAETASSQIQLALPAPGQFRATG